MANVVLFILLILVCVAFVKFIMIYNHLDKCYNIIQEETPEVKEDFISEEDIEKYNLKTHKVSEDKKVFFLDENMVDYFKDRRINVNPLLFQYTQKTQYERLPVSGSIALQGTSLIPRNMVIGTTRTYLEGKEYYCNIYCAHDGKRWTEGYDLNTLYQVTNEDKDDVSRGMKEPIIHYINNDDLIKEE